jgi:hypothetical protein
VKRELRADDAFLPLSDAQCSRIASAAAHEGLQRVLPAPAVSLLFDSTQAPAKTKQQP